MSRAREGRNRIRNMTRAQDTLPNKASPEKLRLYIVIRIRMLYDTLMTLDQQVRLDRAKYTGLAAETVACVRRVKKASQVLSLSRARIDFHRQLGEF
jgi:hypothetical protein